MRSVLRAQNGEKAYWDALFNSTQASLRSARRKWSCRKRMVATYDRDNAFYRKRLDRTVALGLSTVAATIPTPSRSSYS